MNTNNLDNGGSHLETNIKPLEGSIQTALDGYKKSIENTLANGFDTTLKIYQKDYVNSVHSILDMEDKLLGTFKNLGFKIDDKGFHKMQEKENKEPLTLVGTMAEAEDFFMKAA